MVAQNNFGCCNPACLPAAGRVFHDARPAFDFQLLSVSRRPFHATTRTGVDKAPLAGAATPVPIFGPP